MTAVCDFCATPDPEWMYPSDDFTSPKWGLGYTGGWAACTDCSRLIEDDETVKLIERSMQLSQNIRTFEAAFGPMSKAERRTIYDETSSLFRRFRLNRRGPRRPFG